MHRSYTSTTERAYFCLLYFGVHGVDKRTKNLSLTGNLKFDSAPLGTIDHDVSKIKLQIGNRPFWIAASTHLGEEEIIAKTHQRLVKKYPDLLTIICPRHPSRSAALANDFKSYGLNIALRSKNELIIPKTDIYFADTLGEMGTFYHIAEIAFIGGSLVPQSGHNPIEAAQLRCALISGLNMQNFTDAADALVSCKGLVMVSNEVDLANTIDTWLSDEQSLKEAQYAASKCATLLTGALDKTLVQLQPFLDLLDDKRKTSHETP